MKKKPICGNELSLPQLTPVSCPKCGFILGKGAFLNTSDPCFDHSWEKGDFVVVEGVRADRNGALVSKDMSNTICTNCPVNRRRTTGPWPEAHDRRKGDK
jgi:hypothetical protein